ncbi:MAG: hypothetical protein QF515_13680 [Pseudomonadales bacterium]|jgi:hypothetical protein|nr:hypothetical protein [Pseudomonadales bacterium]MDP6828142.1 hypothetical protein [Pseudomonadales bacterium]|tara:strand:- start:322 stop:1059 length:738 start_codon:yes stop_codon:yes gene_type:complete
MHTIIVQSHRPEVLRGWVGRCVRSVRAYARESGCGYLWLGDELFAKVPDWYRDKAGFALPVMADLARLRVIREILDCGEADVACWFDADVLLFAPERVSLEISSSCAFGYELWTERQGQGVRVRRSYHNAVCVFRAGCPVLPFLIHATESIIQRIDAQRIAPQLVGPKLLSALGNIVGFERLETIGALSPDVIRDLAAGGGLALARLRSETPGLAGANLCHSLAPRLGDGEPDRAIDRLLSVGLE